MSNRKGASHSEKWIKSSGSVFADLGVPNPELALLKADISIAIEQAIERKSISQREAGELMSIAAVKVSNIICGRLKGYTLDRLFSYLQRLDVDVQVKMKAKPKGRATAEITGVRA